ncbi:hypothetical protein JCM10908_001248 [Rhodotorula pacifica]|uniref:uncharacterized protein n=1 Tax=Rhodotorula pacifica TaxID=1495444 RepID=UPI00317B96E8
MGRMIAHYIGADLIIFQTLPDLVSSCASLNPELKEFECSVFNGDYLTRDIDEAYLDHLEGLRNDNAKVRAGEGAKGSMTSVNGASGTGENGPLKVVMESQPLDEVSGGGEVAGGGDVSGVVGLTNENGSETRSHGTPPSLTVGLDNSHE